MPVVLPPLSTERDSARTSLGAAPSSDPVATEAPTASPAMASTPPAAPASVDRRTAPVAFQTGSIRAAGFESAPLPPAWIHSGAPQPRSRPLTRSADGRLSSGLWECRAGQFTYVFPCDEIVHILEGDVIVESHGESRHLKPGDVAFFAQDLQTLWTVHSYVKKLAIFRVVPRPLHQRIAARLFGRKG